LQSVKTLMGPNTLLFVGVPGLRNIGSHYRYDFLNYLQPGHLVHFERLTLCRMLEEQGFASIAATERIDAVFKIATTAQPKQEIAYSGDIARDMLQFLLATERKWRSLIFRRFAERVTHAVAWRIRYLFTFVSSLHVRGRVGSA
jgi:hypothetical protein